MNQNNKTGFFLVNSIIVIVAVIALNVISSYVFKRFDFTEEKRYSLTGKTKETLQNLNDLMYVKVYLDGALPADFEKLKTETKELLDEMSTYSKGELVYEFIDLTEINDTKKQNDIYQQLLEKGLEYTDISTNTIGERSDKIIWTGAIATHKEQELAINLFKNKLGAASSDMINNSIQQLEYSFANAFHILQTNQRDHIAFIEGHGEYTNMQVADVSKALKSQYEVARISINGNLEALRLYKTIVIAGPDSTFSKADKFIIDQFIMRGGRVLWLLDAVYVNTDTLRSTSTTMGVSRSLNIEDQLFKYGVRINGNLIMDMNALPIPMVTGQVAGRPKQEFLPWYYSPLLMTDNSSHFLVKNIEAIKTNFISNIDTVSGKNVKKTILLTSSKYAKIQTTPARISYNILRVPPAPEQFNSSNLAVAVLLEGSFTSVFKNRVVPQNDYGHKYTVRDSSIITKQIVFSDADLIRNEVDATGKQYAKLGYDKYTKRIYGNKDLILNCINYLCGDDDLISARAKTFKIRLLNMAKIKKQKFTFQLWLVVLPIFLVLALGGLQLFIRNIKYTK